MHHTFPALRETCSSMCAVIRWAINTLGNERRNKICAMKEKSRIEMFPGIIAEL